MADFIFYITQYGGKLPEEEFARLRARANFFVRAMPEYAHAETAAASMAVCSVADAMSRQDESAGKSSETVGPHSVSYRAAQTADLRKAALTYLQSGGGATWL